MESISLVKIHRLKKRTLVAAAFLATLLSGCSATSSSSSGAANSSASKGPVVHAIYTIDRVTNPGTHQITTITDVHAVSISGGIVTDDHIVKSFNETSLMAVTPAGDLGLFTKSGGTLTAFLFNFSTGEQHSVSADTFGNGGVFSPDGKQFAASISDPVDGSHQITIADVATGSSHALEVTPIGSQSGAARFYPDLWTNQGIIASLAYPESLDGGVLIDPVTGKTTSLKDFIGNTLSPSGQWSAGATHQDLGDAPPQGPGEVSNTLQLVHFGGKTTQLASAKDHIFTQLSVTDEGEVLASSDSALYDHPTLSSDMGLWVYLNGKSYQQYGLDRSGQWQAGQFIDSTNALISQWTGSSEEVDLVHLCISQGCHPSLTKLTSAPSTDTGNPAEFHVIN